MKKFLPILSIVATFCLLSACGDDDYTAGSEPATDAPVVYFSSSNESEVIITDGSETGFDVTLCREDSAEALTVPLVIDYNTGNLTFPESATFAAGQATTTIHVAIGDYVAGTKASVRIAEGYTNPYIKLDGSGIYFVQLVKLNHIADISYQAGSRFESVTSPLYAYSGENKFIWKDFLGSGIDFKFKVDTSNSTGKYVADNLARLNGEIIPLNNYTYNSAGGYYLTDDATGGGYPVWTPAGQTEAVTSFFYWAYSGGIYNFIDFDPADANQGYGYFSSAYVNDVGYESFYFFVNYLTDDTAATSN